jgi:hypothetical protein
MAAAGSTALPLTAAMPPLLHLCFIAARRSRSKFLQLGLLFQCFADVASSFLLIHS